MIHVVYDKGFYLDHNQLHHCMISRLAYFAIALGSMFQECKTELHSKPRPSSHRFYWTEPYK